MFGKPEWFGNRDILIGHLPNGFQGLFYYVVWALCIAAPLVLLLMVDKWPEAIVWGVASSATYTWNSVRLKRETNRRRKLESLFFIADDPAEAVTTSNYELNLKR